MTTPTGLEWSAPSSVHTSCFPQYIISLSNNPTITLTVNSTMASFADLIAAGFPSCISQDLTVTPVFAISGAPLTASSATMQVSIINTGTHCAHKSILHANPLYASTDYYSCYRIPILGAKCQCFIEYDSECWSIMAGMCIVWLGAFTWGMQFHIHK